MMWRRILILVWLGLAVSHEAQAQQPEYRTNIRVQIAEWSPTPNPPYATSDLVKFNFGTFICLNGAGCGAPPNTAGTLWISTGGLFEWNPTDTYGPGAMVQSLGAVYVAKVVNVNVNPVGNSHPETWQLRAVPTTNGVMDASLAPGANMGAKIQASHDSPACTPGCVIWVPPGTYAGVTTVNITKHVIIKGAGINVTILQSSGGTIFSASGVTLELYSMQLNGSGSGTLVSITNSDFSRITDMYFTQMGVGLALNAARSIVVDASVFAQYTSVGITSTNPGDPDSGDNTIVNSLFFGGTGATSAYSWSSGGGVRLVNNKFLGASANTLNFAISSGATGVIFITNNSLEGTPTNASIAISATGAASLDHITILGNQITTGAPPTGILLSGTLRVVAVSSNVIISTGTAISLAGGIDNYTIAGNTINIYGGASPCLSFDAATFRGVVSGNDCRQSTGIASASSFPIITSTNAWSLAQLPASASDGSQLFCFNCTLTGNMGVCAASGGTVGVVATRVSGAWRCQ